ncbi:MAG TPA: hypothetical protein DDX85_00525 [Nitrospiraceae bacterium]|nr:hypothetical protein [Nitrospiraceae bacterium]
MVAGAVVYKKGSRNIDDFAGLNKRMPFTMAAFVIAAISMIGVPPTAGFFSKWYLVLGTIEAGQWVFASALLFSSLINAVIFVRILEKVYFNGENVSIPQSRDEVPLSMLFPVIFMGAGILVLGLYSGDIISSVIQHTVPKGF